MLHITLTQHTKAKVYDFEVIVYYNPMKKEIHMGKAIFIGSGTTDNILLPPGKNPSLFETGRPLHPFLAKNSELLSESEADRLHQLQMNKERYF